MLHKFSVDLPKKHGRGGQSALRFARLRLEKRHNYVRKVAEVSTQMFISNDKVSTFVLLSFGYLPNAASDGSAEPAPAALSQLCLRSLS